MKSVIEFIAEKKQGGMIEIPKEYADDVSGKFRVIIILNNAEKNIAHQREFKAVQLKTKGFKFNRDEIYND